MVKSLNKTLTLIEDKLQQSADNSAKSCDIDSIDIANIDLAKEVGVSSMYLQKAFPLMPGYTIAEYVRNRKTLSCSSLYHLKSYEGNRCSI